MYIKENKGCLGTFCKSEELPILIKLIDAADNLSVQVHPDDKQAKEWENQNGKTEMWYVVQADKGAKMTCGISRDTTKDLIFCGNVNLTNNTYMQRETN